MTFCLLQFTSFINEIMLPTIFRNGAAAIRELSRAEVDRSRQKRTHDLVQTPNPYTLGQPRFLRSYISLQCPYLMSVTEIPKDIHADRARIGPR